MLILGHRGAGGSHDENTLAAMRFALECGADGIEFDVRASREEILVIHDATVDRTTDASGPVADLDSAARKKLRTHHRHAVPSLDDVLALRFNAHLLNIEFKHGGISAEVMTIVRQCVQQQRISDSEVLLSSFDVATSRELAALRGGCRFGLLYESDFEDALSLADELDAWSLHMPLEAVNETDVARAQQHNLRVLVYTVNDRHALHWCAACGVDGIFTDYPDQAVHL